MVKSIRLDVSAKRLGQPEEIASIISWIAADEGGYATGADLSLNGGLHMGWADAALFLENPLRRVFLCRLP
jgi:acetoacetyl-CoA reductase